MNFAISIDSAVISISMEILQGIEPVINRPYPYYIGLRGTANINKLFGKLFLNRVAIMEDRKTAHSTITSPEVLGAKRKGFSQRKYYQCQRLVSIMTAAYNA